MKTKMRIMKRVFTICITILVINFCIPVLSVGISEDIVDTYIDVDDKLHSLTGGIAGVISGAEKFEDARHELDGDSVSSEMQIDQADLQYISNLVFNILLTIGIIAAVIVGLVLGMKFAMASVEQKAQIKESLIPYVVGCAVIFGAFGIWKLVLTILNSL